MIVVRALYVIDGINDCLLFSIIGVVTYFNFNSGVHENHLFVAVLLAYILMLFTHTRQDRALVTFLVVVSNINLFVFYGVTGTELQNRVVGVDLSLVLAILSVIAWPYLVFYVWNSVQPRTARTSLDKIR
jgi:hypothetical protein